MKCIIYTSSAREKKIQIWEIDHYGKLYLMQVKNILGFCHNMSISNKLKKLYLGTREKHSIATFKINHDGSLIDDKIIYIDIIPTYVSIDIENKNFYIASYQNNCFVKYCINQNNDIEKDKYQLFSNLQGCHSINIDKKNNNIWIACLKDNNIKIYGLSYNKVSSIKKVISFKEKNFGPRHIVFHNKKNYVYVINELNSTVSIIKSDYNNQNIIKSRNIIPYHLDNKYYWASDIHITPNDRWLYCCDRYHNIISKFEISPEGDNIIFQNYYNTESRPRSFDIEPRGKFLIVLGEISNYISIYHIDKTDGSLELTDRKKAHNQPIWVSALNLK